MTRPCSVQDLAVGKVGYPLAGRSEQQVLPATGALVDEHSAAPVEQLGGAGILDDYTEVQRQFGTDPAHLVAAAFPGAVAEEDLGGLAIVVVGDHRFRFAAAVEGERFPDGQAGLVLAHELMLGSRGLTEEGGGKTLRLRVVAAGSQDRKSVV